MGSTVASGVESAVRSAFAGIRSNYETHRPVLREAVLRIPHGLVLELGAGDGSTPPLHEVSKVMGRPVVTLESNPEWFAKFAHLKSGDHAVLQVSSSWTELDQPILRGLPYAVAFVDHTPTRRMIDVRWLARAAKVVVVHDTESRDYGYEGMQDLFRWSKTYTDHCPWTSVLSNFVDVSSWTF